MRLILDCDPGLDDALAIYTAHRHGELVAITTVAGNVSVDHTTRNALVVCEAGGLDVPVHRGCAEPLARPLEDARDVHGATGLGDVDRTPSTEIASDDAVGYLLEATHAEPGLHVVAVGPLTNIAAAIERDDSFVERLGSLTIMGGAIRGGNVTAAAEFNIWADPEAAAVVFDSPAHPTMIGLDVTRRVLMGAADRDVFRAAGTPSAALAAELVTFYGGGADNPMHDPSAVLALLRPELFDLRDRPIHVETGATSTRGMTVVDERPTSTAPANARAAYGVDADAVRALITEAVIEPIAR